MKKPCKPVIATDKSEAGPVMSGFRNKVLQYIRGKHWANLRHEIVRATEHRKRK